MRGAVHKHVFARRHAEGIRALCRRAGVTPYMLGVAAFAALLHRYSGEDEIVIGSPFANRVTQAQQSLIGFFINLIPLRVRFDAGVNFLDLLAQVRETSFDAFEHAGLPFDQIVDAIRPPRSSSHAPVFQIMFDYLKSGGMLELDGVGVTGSLVHTGTAKYDLTVSMEEGPDELAAIVEYDTDLFDAGTIARLGGHFERLLENVLASPPRRSPRARCCPPTSCGRCAASRGPTSRTRTFRSRRCRSGFAKRRGARRTRWRSCTATRG